MKVCGRCKFELPLSSFNFKNKERGIYQSYCIECNKIKNREHYLNNKESYRTKAREYVRVHGRTPDRRRKLIYNHFVENPCVDCGESDPIVLTFDHKDPSLKKFTIASARNVTDQEFLEEIAKCDVVCCNCHARRTAKQFNWYSWIKPL